MTQLLTSDELRDLVALAARIRGRSGEAAGDSASSRIGRGYELYDHDLYRPGDDPRAIDWRARMRTGALWVRRFRAEGDGGVRVMLDDSASMTEAKRALAARLAAAIAMVATAASLPVAVDGLARAGRAPDRASVDAVGAPRALARIADIGSLASSRLSLEVALERARRAVQHDEQVVVLSDLADPAPPDELAAAIARLARRVACVHLVDGREQALGAEVDELVDAESSTRRRIDDTVAAAFAARVMAWREAVAHAMRHRGIPIVVLDAANPPRLADAAAELVAAWS